MHRKALVNLQRLLLALTEEHAQASWPATLVDLVGLNMLPNNYKTGQEDEGFVDLSFCRHCLKCDTDFYIMVKQEKTCPKDISQEYLQRRKVQSLCSCSNGSVSFPAGRRRGWKTASCWRRPWPRSTRPS